MNGSRKKAGQAAKPKDKAKKAQAMPARQPPAVNLPTANPGADNRDERVRTMITNLDVPSLHSDDITDICCTAPRSSICETQSTTQMPHWRSLPRATAIRNREMIRRSVS
ncbi:hypothetical protein K7462_30700, partial [Pseudomonas fluorescens]|uniref:hypothetical protein n=1 Tax=Pseudomonas fluorescens TaxID=294 RepID=UPI001CA68373